MSSNRLYIVLTFSVMILIGNSLHAQQREPETLQFQFRGDSMIEVIDHIARETDIDLVYDPVLVQNITVYKRLQSNSLPELLTSLLSDYNLDFITLSSGTIVIVRSPKSAPSYGTLSGKIVDGQTGEPLPGATVLLADASGGTSSNRAGYFSMNRVMSGSHQIIISYLGYESAFKTINISPDSHIQETIPLIPKQIDVQPLVVEAHRPRLPDNMSEFVIDPGSNVTPSGFLQSPIRNLNLVSGVQYGLPMQDLHVQGSHQGEHRIQLDGIPVYNPYSFGQLFSSFSPFAIGNVELYKAGYGVQEGSQMAGIVNLKNDLSGTKNNSAIFQADPLSLNVRGDISIPVKKDKAIRTMSAIRTSYWDVYQNPSLKNMLSSWDGIDPLITNQLLNLDGDARLYTPYSNDSDVHFFDFHFAAGFDPDDFSSITASFYVAENVVETRVLNQVTNGVDSPRFLHASDSHNWTNMLGQIQWSKMVTPRLDLSIQGAYSENRFSHQYNAGLANYSPFATLNSFSAANPQGDAIESGSVVPLPNQIDGNRIQHALSKIDLSYSFSPTFSLEAGLNLDNVYSEVDISDLTYLGANTSQSSIILGSYLKNNHQLGQKWRFTYGTRFTFLNTTNHLYAEPRFSIQFDQPESKIGYWSVRLAAGLYRQFINEFRITNTGATSIVPDVTIWSHSDESAIPKAYHLTSSFLVEPTSQTSLTIEGFYKWQPISNITSYGNLVSGTDLDRTEIGAFAQNTEMTLLGSSIRMSHDVDALNLRFIAGYDYSYSRVNLDQQFGQTLTTPWNEPHRVQLRSMFRIFPELMIVGKWQGIWGRSWAYRQSYYNYLRSFNPDDNRLPSFDNPSKDKLSSFQQVDLSFIYQPKIYSSDMEFRLELINLFNRRNQIERYLIPVYNNGELIEYKTENRVLSGFYPSASIQISF